MSKLIFLLLLLVHGKVAMSVDADAQVRVLSAERAHKMGLSLSLDEFDANKDGHISAAEEEAMFNLFDSNKDGMMDRSDLNAMLTTSSTSCSDMKEKSYGKAQGSDFTVHNALPHIQADVNRSVQIFNRFSPSVNHYLHQGGVDDYLGPYRLHKHFDVRDNEAIISKYDDASGETRTAASPVPSSTEHLKPYVWKRHNGNWVPLAFVDTQSVDPSAQRAFNDQLSKMEAARCPIEKLGSLLESRKITNDLGLMMSLNSITGGHKGSRTETTDEHARKQVTTAGDAGKNAFEVFTTADKTEAQGCDPLDNGVQVPH